MECQTSEIMYSYLYIDINYATEKQGALVGVKNESFNTHPSPHLSAVCCLRIQHSITLPIIACLAIQIVYIVTFKSVTFYNVACLAAYFQAC